jgi:chaperonin GroES
VKLKAIKDKIIVKYEESPTSQSGIILAPVARNNPDRGTIVSVGPGGVDDKGNEIKMVLKEGQKVLFGRATGVKVKVDSETFLVMRQSDVQALIS